MRSHHFSHGVSEETVAEALHRATNVAVCDDTDDVFVFHCYAKSQTSGGHAHKCLAHTSIGGGGGQIVGAHHVACASQQTTSQGAARMKAGKISGLEVARHNEGAGECIAQRKRDGGARGRCQTHGAGFVLHGDVQVHRTILCQKRSGIAAHTNNGHFFCQEIGEKAEQFVGFARVGDGQDEVVVGDHAQIAVKGVEGIDKEAGSPGRGEGGSDFCANMSAFTHARHDNFAGAGHNEADGFVKFVADGGNQRQKCLSFVAEALNGGVGVNRHGSF